LERLEREWLHTLSPKSPIDTLSQALQRAELSQTFQEQRVQVTAALEGSGLADESAPDRKDLKRALYDGGLEPLEWDVALTGKPLRTRAIQIARALSRPRARTTLSELRNHRRRLQELRNQVTSVSRRFGEMQIVTACVADPGLQELLGETISLN